MQRLSRSIVACAVGCLAGGMLRGQDADTANGIRHRLLVAGSGTKFVAIVDEEGKVEWQYPVTGPANDAWLLPNGNVLFSDRNSATEVTREKQIAWQYKAADEPKGQEIHAVQPLPDGNRLVAQNGHPARIMEIAPDGKVVKEIRIETSIKNPHAHFRQVRKTLDGTYIGGLVGEPEVKEYDGDGKVIRTFAVPRHGFGAVRLPDGNTLIPCGDGHALIEFDKDGNEVWRLDEDDIPGNPLRFVAGVQRLPNGNTVIANWLGHGGHTGKQAQLLEVTRDKKLVWQLWDPRTFGNLSSVHVLDADGDPCKGEVLR